jgi:hypothetical protein
VIVAAAFCPHPPVLVPALAQGAAEELAGVRAACRAAITRVAAAGAPLVVIGSGPVAAVHDATARGSFAGFGLPVEVSLGSDEIEAGTPELPLSLTVGAWLVRDALGPGTGTTGISIAGDAELSTNSETALIVMGDGSARRSTAAPGYLDERAEAFDADVAAALSSGDRSRLAALDPHLGAELLAAGVPAWRAAGALVEARRYRAELLYADAPYGVGYFVAAWT